MQLEREEIERQIKIVEGRIRELEAERKVLLNALSGFWQNQVLRPGDVLNSKNAFKFELLGKITSYLKSLDQKGRERGKKASEIYDYLIKHYKMYKDDLPYNTFRSHLHRFGKDERLVLDPLYQRWKLPEGKENE